MQCPDCGFDNIDGIEFCESCNVSLVEFDPQGNEIERSITSHSVNVLCPKEPVCVQASTPVRAVIDDMVARNIGCVLVLEGTELAGVFSERDVLNKVSPDLSCLNEPVGDFMTPSPFTITKRDSIGYALQAMDIGGYRHMPVVSSTGEPRGIISARDILRFLCVKYAQSRS